MKKYITGLVLVLFLAVTNTAYGAYNIASKSLMSLIESRAVQINLDSTMTSYNNYSGGSSMFSNKTDTIKFTVNAGQDMLTPGNVKANQKFTLSGSGLMGMGLTTSTMSIEDKIIGDTVYFKIPSQFLGFMMGGNTQSVSSDQWIQINPTTLAALPSEFNFMKEIYNYFVSFNSQPTQFLKSHQADILQFTQAFNLTKYKNKVIDGNNITIYKFSLNKSALRKAMIANAKSEYSNGKVPASKIKLIDQELASMNIKNGYFSVYSNTNLPYGISGTVQAFDTYSKKITSSTNFDISFADFEKPLVVNPPDSYITILDFYNIYIKPSLEVARNKGTDAALKANFANLRSQSALFYDDNNGYGAASNNGSCSNPAVGSLFDSSTGSSMLDIKEIISQIQKLSNGNSACYSTVTAYAISAKLPGSEGYYCVDSNGTSKNTTSQVTGTVCQ